MGEPIGGTDEAAHARMATCFDGKGIDRGIVIRGEDGVRAEIHDPTHGLIVVAPDEEIFGRSRRFDRGLQEDVFVGTSF